MKNILTPLKTIQYKNKRKKAWPISTSGGMWKRSLWPLGSNLSFRSLLTSKKVYTTLNRRKSRFSDQCEALSRLKVQGPGHASPVRNSFHRVSAATPIATTAPLRGPASLKREGGPRLPVRREGGPCLLVQTPCGSSLSALRLNSIPPYRKNPCRCLLEMFLSSHYNWFFQGDLFK